MENRFLYGRDNRWRDWVNPFRCLKNWYDKVRWTYQRASRGYADCDIWSLDSYLAEWLLDALRDISELTPGYPADMTMDQWEKELEEMACAFELLQDVYEIKPGEEKLINRGLHLFASRFRHFWAF